MKQQVLLDWFDQNKRDLPWRSTTPWGVMVSEFMLQQTPVNRVLPIWTAWVAKWPTPSHLAAAKRSEVIKAWGRLGYPRRALRLHESATIITNDFDNKVPQSVPELRTLPGVGEYTAAAIAAFAFNESVLVLDINIRRFFARMIDGLEYPTSTPTSTERARRAELIPDEGAKWAAATMEFGALVCRSKNPTCDLCPLKRQCAWRKAGYPPSTLLRKSQDWVGTDRQCRGTIVQALRENEKLSGVAIKKLWHDSSQIERALESLILDRLIELYEEHYSLPR